MKNEENLVENLVAPAPKLFGNEIVRPEMACNETGGAKSGGDAKYCSQRHTVLESTEMSFIPHQYSWEWDYSHEHKH